MIIPIILSGGSGTRLWPLSRQAYPKQFLPLIGDLSLFQGTLKRLDGLKQSLKPLVICNEEHRFLVAEQLHQLDTRADIMLEPEGRNTAPAIACAAHFVSQHDPDTILLVMPSDHVIEQSDKFIDAVLSGEQAAKTGGLITFGIPPTRPETAFGYIKRGNLTNQASVYHIDKFVEKPDKATAEGYLSSGQYDWNSGIFMFSAKHYLEELETHHPDISQAAALAVKQQQRDLDFIRLDKEHFLQCPAQSIDYAVMEKTQHAKVIPMDAGWNDLGSWSALQDIEKKDSDNNVLQGDVLTKEVTNCYIRAEQRLVATLGIDNLIIIETADAVMVADANHSQDVKDIVMQLRDSGREECNYQMKVFRPWGHYETIDQCNRFKVKRILVKPGASLSLQMHYHRSEHWVVVSGTAKVTKGEEQLVLHEDQSIYIPLGTHHRLENPGVIPLEIIEIQTGSYLGEDDIVRFSDKYGRSC